MCSTQVDLKFWLQENIAQRNFRSTMKPKWTQEDLHKALQAVSNGMSKREAASTYNIPWGTFACKLTGRRKMDTTAPQTYLTLQEEEEIIKFIKDSSDRGFGQTKQELMLTVQNMLNARGRTTKWPANKPSEKWYRLFKKRHPQIVLRTPQKLGKQRALVRKSSIMKWFADFKATLTDIDASILLDPSRIYNCDESGFSLDASSGKVLSFVGTKFVYQVGSEQKTMITVLVCCSASGHFVHPMMIYPGTQFRGFKPQEVFNDSFITKSKNGWTNQSIFLDWLQQVFQPQTAHVKRPVLLLVDGHISHQSIEAATFCRDNGIILYALPPHASHLMQPLDVGIFKTMKAEWRKSVKKQNESEIVTKRTFALVFKEAYETTIKRDLAPQAFKNSGIYPLDQNNIEWQKILPDITVDDQTSASIPQFPAVSSSSSVPAPVLPASASSLPSSLPMRTPAPAAASSSSAPASSSSSSLPMPTPAPAAASSSSVPASISTASTSACSDGRSSLSSTVRKYSMICAQIGEETLNLYFKRLEEGYDCQDSLFSLWKEYHTVIVGQSTGVNLMKSSESDDQPVNRPTEDPLTLPTIKKGTVKRKVQQLPSLISGNKFIEHLMTKDRMEKEETERKEKRKLDMARKRHEKAKENEEKKKKKEELAKLRLERKKEKEEKIQRRKESRKRQMEAKRTQTQREKEKQNVTKKRKVMRKKISEESDTSVDESEMVLDDSSDIDFVDEDFDNLLEDDTFEIEKAIAEAESTDIVVDKSTTTGNKETTRDRSLWEAFSVDLQTGNKHV